MVLLTATPSPYDLASMHTVVGESAPILLHTTPTLSDGLGHNPANHVEQRGIERRLAARN